MSIPPHLFQTWKSKTDIPGNFAYWSQTFRTENPGYDYWLWDDDDNRAFIASHYPWFLPTYDAYPAEIFRADAVRYFFLYHFGGIYADMDTECLRPFDTLLDKGDVILGRMGTDGAFPHALPNAVMLSRPRQEFWLLVMALLLDPGPKPNPRPEYATGPVLLKKAHALYTGHYESKDVQAWIGSIRSKLAAELQAPPLPSRVGTVGGHVFFPVDWNDRIHDSFFRRPMLEQRKIFDRKTILALFPRSFTVSYWAHSWEPHVKKPAATGSGLS